MRNDKTTLVAKSSKVILGVGKLLVEKHGITRAQDTTQTMRKLAHFLIQLRRIGQKLLLGRITLNTNFVTGTKL